MTQFEMCICCCKVCFYPQSSLPSWHAVWCADRWEFEGELKQEPNSSEKEVTTSHRMEERACGLLCLFPCTSKSRAVHPP